MSKIKSFLSGAQKNQLEILAGEEFQFGTRDDHFLYVGWEGVNNYEQFLSYNQSGALHFQRHTQHGEILPMMFPNACEDDEFRFAEVPGTVTLVELKKDRITLKYKSAEILKEEAGKESPIQDIPRC